MSILYSKRSTVGSVALGIGFSLNWNVRAKSGEPLDEMKAGLFLWGSNEYNIISDDDEQFVMHPIEIKFWKGKKINSISIAKTHAGNFY